MMDEMDFRALALAKDLHGLASAADVYRAGRSQLQQQVVGLCRLVVAWLRGCWFCSYVSLFARLLTCQGGWLTQLPMCVCFVCFVRALCAL